MEDVDSRILTKEEENALFRRMDLERKLSPMRTWTWKHILKNHADALGNTPETLRLTEEEMEALRSAEMADMAIRMTVIGVAVLAVAAVMTLIIL